MCAYLQKRRLQKTVVVKKTQLQQTFAKRSQAMQSQTKNKNSSQTVDLSWNAALGSSVSAKTPVRYFSERVPKAWIEKCLAESSHPIFELELLAVLGCTLSLGAIDPQQSMRVTDNEAAKGTLINATSTTFGKQICGQRNAGPGESLV
jgi:hypothetical protein